MQIFIWILLEFLWKSLQTLPQFFYRAYLWFIYRWYSVRIFKNKLPLCFLYSNASYFTWNLGNFYRNLNRTCDI
ncbi:MULTISPECIES: hypothetical protein [Helicobacter]|uniref:hypothetical protein n=1 Tax=Helicobacter TaxID=209 RepID=UPI00261E50E6|nr:hypothetical protein [Helicobacter sp. UBA3407]